jgi:hypothetical protein
MNQNPNSSAEIGVGVQMGGGFVTYEFGYVIERLMRDATETFRIQSLDARVRRLAFLLRVSGKFTVFEGDDVENVKFGRYRSSVSVDWLYAEKYTKLRDIRALVALVTSRLRKTPNVLAAVCAQRAVKIDYSLFLSECDIISNNIELYANDSERFKRWKESVIDIEKEIIPKYRSFV